MRVKKVLKRLASLVAIWLIVQKVLLLVSVGIVFTPWDDALIVLAISNFFNIPSKYQIYMMIGLYLLAVYVIYKWSPKSIRNKLQRVVMKVKGWLKSVM